MTPALSAFRSADVPTGQIDLAIRSGLVHIAGVRTGKSDRKTFGPSVRIVRNNLCIEGMFPLRGQYDGLYPAYSLSKTPENYYKGKDRP
jgi:hypothetical protein